MKAILIAALFFFSNKFSYGQNFAWAKHFEGTQNGRGNSIAVDISGNVYTTGYFTGTVDFDPGPGIFNLTQSSGGGAFISKLDASGNFIWAKQFESWNIVSFSIALDATGNVYTTGFFQQIADFDPGPGVFNLTNVLGSDVFVCKLDNIGNFIWAKQFGGINNIYLQGYDMAVDAMGNVFTTGHFEGVADFDPGPGVFNLSPVGFEDMFISKLDMNGNFIWVKQIKGASYETGYSID